ncbi:phosphate ABC transporter permease PstA [Abiotrophia defectiva]|uniref:phosphate ABC transporter permease PstA n=1 Tax=Abiotrophia defectiva TaxID=46125 RepID=UPI0030CEAB7D
MSKLTWVKWLIYASAAFTLGMLAFIVGFIVWNGLGALRPSLFAWDYTTDNLSLTPALISTLITVGLSLAIATPIGVFTGFYLVEYADRKSRVVKVIRLAADTLAAVPSIVYGLFGMLFFVIYLRFQFSLLAGILTIVIMVLPIIISATEEGLLQVDNSLRMGSLALGAGKLRTIFTVVLPVAMPAILQGVILAVGRIVGETAALLFTLGSATGLPSSLMSSSRTLSLHMYVLSSEGLHLKEAYATGTVIILLVLAINGLSSYIGRRLSRGGN